jgi:predicted phage terminase large subunit-like protein
MKKLDNLSGKAKEHNFKNFIFDCFAATNPSTEYIHNWHVDLLAEYLDAVEAGDLKRLIINIPPRSMKSTIVTVAWPAWLLGQNPANRIIAASYSQSLATKHSLDTRLIIESDWYKEIYPKTKLVADQNQKNKFVTTKRGFRMATSVGGTITGDGGNFLIIDDPHNPKNIFSENVRKSTLNWYDQVFSSRLDDKKKGVILLVMQRLHQDDLTGYLLAKKSSEWENIIIPAIADRKIIYDLAPYKKKRKYFYEQDDILNNKRDTKSEILAFKEEVGSFVFSAQYMQNPIPEGGGMIGKDWFLRYNIKPENLQNIAASWDTGIKSGKNNDYTVCTIWGEGENAYYLLDIFRGKFDYPELKRSVKNISEKWQAESVLIEDKGSGQSLIQDLKRETKLPIIPIIPKIDKISRVASISAIIESGKVYIPSQADWMIDFESEVFAFPYVNHDDQVDSLSQYLNWAKNKTSIKATIRRL